MAKRIVFSGENKQLAEVAIHYNDAESALTLYFSAASPVYSVRFVGYRPSEVREELSDRIAELDRSASMSLLAAVEAAFRIDYLQRCYQKKKDIISRRFREVFREKEAYASLEQDILEVWKDHTTGSARLIADLRGAFKFRHWMAHGRYWTPKLGRNYDFRSVYPLALQTLVSFPLVTC